MLVNKPYNFGFLHVPKSGGTYVRRTLLATVPGTVEETFGSDRHIGIHAAPKEYDNLSLMVNVRDPLHQYVSLYEHIKRNGFGNDACQEWVGFSNDKGDFQEWLKRIVTQDLRDDCWDCKSMNDSGSTTKYINFMKDHRTDYGWWGYTLVYQTVREWENFIQNEELTVENFRKHSSCDFFLPQESLTTALVDNLHLFGVSPEYISNVIRCPAQNVGNVQHDKYLDYYTPELIDLVRKREKFIYDLLEECSPSSSHLGTIKTT